VARGLITTLAAALALAVAPLAHAGGIVFHVGGTGGGYVTTWPHAGNLCRQGSPLDQSGCLFNDNGGGLIMQAVPDPGSTFDGWPSPTCSLYPGGYCQVSSSGNGCCVQLNVSFTKIRVGVTVGIIGNGTVTSSAGGISCPDQCSATYDWGAQVTLQPQPAEGWRFSGWSGSCSGAGGCVLTPTAAATVTATFELASFPVTVGKAGAGSGKVTSAPVGIACGGTCSAPFFYDTPLQLTATAATGSRFAGWTGACSGTGRCSIEVGAAPVAVTARFARVQPVPKLAGRRLHLALRVDRASRLAIALVGRRVTYRTAARVTSAVGVTLTLPRSLPPGRYALRLVLSDALGSAKLTAPSVVLRG
jgi:hypothetical protein